jgi:hypothetical protein
LNADAAQAPCIYGSGRSFARDWHWSKQRVFSVVDTLLLRPSLRRIGSARHPLSRSPGLNVEQDWFSPGQYLDVKTQNNVFDQTAVAIGGSFNLTGQEGRTR